MPTRDKVCGSRSAGQHVLGSAVAAQVALGGRRCLEPGAAASLSARPRPLRCRSARAPRTTLPAALPVGAVASGISCI